MNKEGKRIDKIKGENDDEIISEDQKTEEQEQIADTGLPFLSMIT